MFEIKLIICIKMDLVLTDKGWYAIKPKQLNDQSSRMSTVDGVGPKIYGKTQIPNFICVSWHIYYVYPILVIDITWPGDCNFLL